MSIRISMAVVLFLVLLGMLAFAVAEHKARNNDFSLLDAVCTGGKLSLFKLGQLTCLVISSWGFITITVSGKMTEWYFYGYMAAWAGANLASKLIDKAKEKDDGTT